MSPAAAFTLTGAVLAAFLAVIARRLSTTPLWRDLERLWPVGAMTALFGTLDLLSASPGPAWLVATFARLEVGTALLVALAWLRYSAVVLYRQPGRYDRRVTSGAAIAAAAAQVPGLAVDASGVHLHADPLLGGAWREVPMTPAGHAIALAAMALGLWTLARFVRAGRRGGTAPGFLALSIGGALLVTGFDYLIRADLLAGPHLLVPALVLPVAAAAWILAVRFVEDADALHALRDRLEALVEERTRDLAETHAALLQAEKLAALGQFAAGVAHEVNNPASVVTANLAHLSTNLPRGMDVAEAQETADESLEAMRRINDLVRKLLDAGRLADLPPDAGTVELASAVRAAVEEVRGRGRRDVGIANRVPEELLVMGGSGPVKQILANLIANAVDAIPADRDGQVTVTARADGARVITLIQDDGAGMGSDVLRRAFDPFFTTKAVGRGSGLGLPITRGLVEGIGGQIRLESEPGAGTRAVVELPIGRPA